MKSAPSNCDRRTQLSLPPSKALEFIEAQDRIYSDILAELRAGKKQTHWMWYVFPQLKKLGESPISKRYGIDDLAEAKAYAAHPVLGVRLRQCVGMTLAIEKKTANQIFGSPDDLKFRSCLTLFGAATGDELFRDALKKYYSGQGDPRTNQLLAQ